MPANFTIPLQTVIPGQLIASALWNNEFENIDTNFTPAGMDDASVNDTAFETDADPYPGSVISRPTTLEGEIYRIRFQLRNITGKTKWQHDPDVDIATFKTRFDAHTHTGAANQGPQIPTGGIADAAVTEAKLNASVAGNGLTGGAGSPLAVNPDGTTLEIAADQVRVKDLGISTAKIADTAVTNAKINSVDASKVTGTIGTSQIANAAVDANKLAASVAGDGLTGGAGTPLAVNPGTGLEISADTIRIAAAAAGNGLTGGGGSALAVNPDGSTLEISADAVRIKDAGVTEAKLATAVVNKLGQNIGPVTFISTSSNGTHINYTGQGRLVHISATGGSGASGQITIDGVVIFWACSSGQHMTWGVGGLVATPTAGQAPINLNFKTSLVVTKDSGSGTVTMVYERAA